MKITKELLKEKGACGSGTRAFIERFPDGAEYQEVLDALGKENNASWAYWLISNFGKTDAVMEVDELNVEASIFFAGKIIVKGAIKIAKWLIAGEGIEAGEGIKAGWGIKAGSGIDAGWGIEAGSGIEAGEGIKAGADYGIFAGLKVRISRRKEYATIKAKTKPENIICGEYIQEGDSVESHNPNQ